MKAIIEIEEGNLSSIKFLNNKKKVTWADFTQEQKEEFVNALRSFTSLFSKCL